MYTERIKYLTEKFFAGNCNEAEKYELAVWIKQNPDEVITEALEKEWNGFESEVKMPAQVSDRILGNIIPANQEDLSSETAEKETPVQRYLWPKMAAAAVIILSIGLYWWSRGNDERLTQQPVLKLENADIPPGGNKAMLTFGDGSSIMLDSAKNGNLATQGSTNITKSRNGELVYTSGNADRTAVFNTVTTPKGGQYHIVLPDGSKAWLNAASSLKFPTAFSGKERSVEITGEVYFEVAPNSKMPFTVQAGETRIAVLGTHFNVMAYADEKIIRTTLLEGSVKVSHAGKSALLVPGQQARIKAVSEQILVASDVDVEKELAWKNGYFQFKDDNLDNIMRQISRWYDVEVTYEGNPGKETFTGKLPRSGNVSKVFKILSLSGVKFRIEGKSIIVTP
jgi:transmembrane sensor